MTHTHIEVKRPNDNEAQWKQDSRLGLLHDYYMEPVLMYTTTTVGHRGCSWRAL